VPLHHWENIIPPSPTPTQTPTPVPQSSPHTVAIANAYHVSERAGHFGHADICLSNCNAESISHSSKLESLLGGCRCSTQLERRGADVLFWCRFQSAEKRLRFLPKANAAWLAHPRQTDEARMAVTARIYARLLVSPREARVQPAQRFRSAQRVKHQRACCGTPSHVTGALLLEEESLDPVSVCFCLEYSPLLDSV